MLARCLSYGLAGVSGFPVIVQCHTANGLPMMDVIGLPDASVKESRERVRAALVNSGYIMPVAHITVNLAPADRKKEGPSFDLPIAISVMIASGQLSGSDISNTLIFGELSLDGSIQPVRGALALVISAHENDIDEVILPQGNAEQVACLQGIKVYPVQNLREVVNHINHTECIEAQIQKSYQDQIDALIPAVDMSQIQGQAAARRALEICASGGHNMLMIGVPGSGKTMLARSLPGILPPLTFKESMETTRIHSIAGKLNSGSGLMVARPFGAPHHSASIASLIGGGSDAKPGMVSLCHNGILFLDELPEFSKNALESLRQPLQDGFVSVSRVHNQAEYQSNFMLVASMNPCPCGYYGSKTRQCRCNQHEIRRYLDRVSGPLLDRIDIQIEVDSVPVKQINQSKASESSAEVAKRVLQARLIQQKRYQNDGIHCNAQLDSKLIKKYCILDDQSTQILHMAVDRTGMSMRAYSRVLKVARTIADLDGYENIQVQHIAEAIQYRELDGKYWRS